MSARRRAPERETVDGSQMDEKVFTEQIMCYEALKGEERACRGPEAEGCQEKQGVGQD